MPAILFHKNISMCHTSVGLCLGVLGVLSPQCWAVYCTYPGSPGRLELEISPWCLLGCTRGEEVISGLLNSPGN